jgi:hypothetical protein
MYRCISHWLVLIVFLLFSACNEEESPLRAPELSTPIINGLFLTDASGNPVGKWGSPNHKISGNATSCAQKIELNAYPVPASFFVNLRYSSACNLPVTIWVTPAQLADDLQSDAINFGNALLLKAGGLSIKTLAKEQSGINQIMWDGTDDTGKVVPPGFYRIYFRTGDLLLWEDVLLYQDNVDNIPLSLLKIFGNG